MNIDADTLEKAAFACFSNRLEDSYKRLLFLNIEKVIQENPNISRNGCFARVRSKMSALTNEDFNCAVAAMKIPFQRLSTHEYKTRGQNARAITHLCVVNSEPWNLWSNTVKERYPELTIWLR